MTYRERREARAERLRGWADQRQATADAVFASHEPYRGDIAFNTQPGHIPLRSRMNAQAERQWDSLKKADRMDERAGNIKKQLAGAIYSDDENAEQALLERIANLEAERARIKAYNVSCRKGKRDVSILNAAEQANLVTIARVASYSLGKNGEYPAYHLTNLSGNITRNKQRLERLTVAGNEA